MYYIPACAQVVVEFSIEANGMSDPFDECTQYMNIPIPLNVLAQFSRDCIENVFNGTELGLICSTVDRMKMIRGRAFFNNMHDIWCGVCAPVIRQHYSLIVKSPGAVFCSISGYRYLF